MESSPEILFQYGPILRVYKDGRFERDVDPTGGYMPPTSDPSLAAGVISKDIVPIPGASGPGARLYLPADLAAGEKLPIFIYFHGGGFFMGSPFSPFTQNYLQNIVKSSRAVAVAIGYRLVPEHRLPAAYEDCYAAFKWAITPPSAAGDDTSDEWLRNHGDFNKIIVAGDSAGANIAHNILMRAGEENIRVSGMALLFPYFWGSERLGREGENKSILRLECLDNQWTYFCPEATDNDDYRINPTAEGAPGLGKIGSHRALVVVAENDALFARGKAYADALRRSGWDGEVELVEYDGEDHCFHVINPGTANGKDVMDRLVKFIRA